MGLLRSPLRCSLRLVAAFGDGAEYAGVRHGDAIAKLGSRCREDLRGAGNYRASNHNGRVVQMASGRVPIEGKRELGYGWIGAKR